MRNTDGGSRREGKGKMQRRDLQSIICGVEGSKRCGAPSLIIQRGHFVALHSR